MNVAERPNEGMQLTTDKPAASSFSEKCQLDITPQSKENLDEICSSLNEAVYL